MKYGYYLRDADQAKQIYLSEDIYMSENAEFHDSVEFIFVLEGEILANISDQSRVLSSGMICFVNSYENHFYKPLTEKTNAYVLVLSREYTRTFQELYDGMYFNTFMLNTKINEEIFSLIRTWLGIKEKTYLKNLAYTNLLFAMFIDKYGLMRQRSKSSDVALKKVLLYNVTFTGCSIYGTGAGGIGVERGASNVTIDGNSFSYTAGTAIFVGDNEDSNDNLPTNIVITNNTVSSYGMAYGGAAGITVTYADTVTVSHNTVQNGYYSGISLGWGWTKNANVQHRNYTVTYNRIVNAMAGTLYDGGGIYLLGNFVADSTNVVANNYVEISATCLAAIYLDEGTSDYKVYNNALKVNTGNTDKGCIFLHNKLNSKTEIGLQNIEIYDNYSNYKTCGYKYSRNGVGPLWASAYNSTYSVSYENATVSSTEHINESIYANSGANVA